MSLEPLSWPMNAEREHLIKGSFLEERFREGTDGKIWRLLDWENAVTVRYLEAGVIFSERNKKKKKVLMVFSLRKEKNLLCCLIFIYIFSWECVRVKKKTVIYSTNWRQCFSSRRGKSYFLGTFKNYCILFFNFYIFRIRWNKSFQLMFSCEFSRVLILVEMELFFNVLCLSSWFRIFPDISFSSNNN